MTHSVNTDMIEELKELMEEDFPLLIETFLTDSDKRMLDLEAAISENNAIEIRELAHGFKGSSSNLGAEKLAEISFIIETMGREDDLSDIAQAYTQLNENYRLVKEYFSSLI